MTEEFANHTGRVAIYCYAIALSSSFDVGWSSLNRHWHWPQTRESVSICPTATKLRTYFDYLKLVESLY